MIKRILILLILLPTLSLPVVLANETYSIPLQGGAWSIDNIPVYIPPTPQLAHNLTVQALEIWNQSMIWFTETYYPNTPLYSFTIVQTGAKLNVEFQEYPRISGSACGSGGFGCASPIFIGNGIIYRDLVTIATEQPSKMVLRILLHEFGHSLGLGHSGVPSDLMNAGIAITTLDLYAVYTLKTLASLTSATLPKSIPYVIVPIEEPLPEFDLGTAFIVCVSLSVLTLQVRVRQRRR